MLAKDVRENRCYIVDYGLRQTIFRVTHTCLFRQGIGPWWGVNLKTGRQVKIKTARRLRREATACEIELFQRQWARQHEATMDKTQNRA